MISFLKAFIDKMLSYSADKDNKAIGKSHKIDQASKDNIKP
jgi:hypothetical protein